MPNGKLRSEGKNRLRLMLRNQCGIAFDSALLRLPQAATPANQHSTPPLEEPVNMPYPTNNQVGTSKAATCRR